MMQVSLDNNLICVVVDTNENSNLCIYNIMFYQSIEYLNLYKIVMDMQHSHGQSTSSSEQKRWVSFTELFPGYKNVLFCPLNQSRHKCS